MRPEKIKSALILGAKYLVSLAILAIILGPVFITFFTSVKTQAHMATTSPLALPPMNELTWANYEKVLTAKLLAPAIRNTALITVVSVVLNILLGSVTAYSLQRFDFKLKALVMGCFYLGMLVPTFVVEIARFKVIQGFGLYNSLGAPIIIYVASDLMQLYIYRQFLSTLPVSLDESALMDGCGYFQLFTRIIFPLLAPATATVAIIKAITIINDMYIPYLYMPKNKLRTLPTILIYVFFQRYILSGVAAGAVKE